MNKKKQLVNELINWFLLSVVSLLIALSARNVLIVWAWFVVNCIVFFAWIAKAWIFKQRIK